jgi:Tol biopolymer transport system component
VKITSQTAESTPLRPVGMVVLAFALAALLASPGAAYAAFPGPNGRILVSSAVQVTTKIHQEQLVSINPDGSVPVQLTQSYTQGGSGGDRGLWSPDSKKIVYTTDPLYDDPGGIAVMNADGSNQTRLTAQHPDVALTWSPDGQKILFQSFVEFNPNQFRQELFTMNADGSGRTSFTGIPADLPSGPTWSPDGRKIAFSMGDHIVLRNPDGTGQTTIATKPVDARSFSSPEWSPDSRKIAFSTDYFPPDPAADSIYTINADGSGQRKVASRGQAPAWSPDGRKIVFQIPVYPGQVTELGVINADGSGRQDIPLGMQAGGPQWGSAPLIRATPLTLSVTPRKGQLNKLSTYRFRATAASKSVAGATVRFGGQKKTTDAAGRAAIAKRFRKPGRQVARVTKPGYQPANTSVRIGREAKKNSHKGKGGRKSHRNHAPIAKPDRWKVQAGWTLDGNVLANDRDPDGDKITAKATKISFASSEWSGLDSDGGFLYTAGPGTSRELRKTITYEAVDSKGARSRSAKAEITIEVPAAAKNPPLPVTGLPASASTWMSSSVFASATAPTFWNGPSSWARSCFDSGVKTTCYTMLNVATTVQFNSLTGWADLQGAYQVCLKYGLIPLKNSDCAKNLLKSGFSSVWNKSVINNAAMFGDCLMFRVSRHRTLRHPFAGVWGKPEYATLDSLVKPYDGDVAVTGYGTWQKGLTGHWRVPLFCNNDNNVYRLVNQPLTEVP